MNRQVLAMLVSLLLITSACTLTPASPAATSAAPTQVASAVAKPSSTSTPAITSRPTASPTVVLPPVEGLGPSYKVAAFYYPWYGNPTVDRAWIHWDLPTIHPPKDISSDYYPALGAYSSNDPQVVAQHMTWLRQAGIGLIIVSWWGQASQEERPVPLILQMADRYGLKVAFHIEPYSGRTATRLVNDIQYLYHKYGSDPAFFRSTATTRYSPNAQPKGMFFVWNIGFPDNDQPAVTSDYWQKALDAIHALPQGALVIANTTEGSWIEGGHFDGLYNYATLHLDQSNGFAWARSLPPDSLYIPSVIPGFSGKRINDPPDTFVPREDGATYNDQWSAALNTGLQPDLVTVTSFNEWHEGTMIEPPAVGLTDSQDTPYADFGPLSPTGYLDLTRGWIAKYLARSWPAPVRVRLRIRTTSDWTTLNVVSGGQWARPELVSASATASQTGMEAGDHFILTQPLAQAEAGQQVEMVYDVLFIGLDPAEQLKLNLDRGSLGSTQVTLYNYTGSTPVELKTFTWGGITTGRNSFPIQLSAALLTNTHP
jgi:glycoprotein endo-alpha-1,2-mannosidase